MRQDAYHNAVRNLRTSGSIDSSSLDGLFASQQAHPSHFRIDLATWLTPLSTRNLQEDLSPWIWTFQEIGLLNQSQGTAESWEANFTKITKNGDIGSVIKRLEPNDATSLPSAVGIES
jgi:hypothetical protein